MSNSVKIISETSGTITRRSRSLGQIFKSQRQRLRSARRCLPTVPRHRRSTLGRLEHSQSPDLSGSCFQTNSKTPTAVIALSLHSGSHWRHSSSTIIHNLYSPITR